MHSYQLLVEYRVFSQSNLIEAIIVCSSSCSSFEFTRIMWTTYPSAYAAMYAICGHVNSVHLVRYPSTLRDVDAKVRPLIAGTKGDENKNTITPEIPV